MPGSTLHGLPYPLGTDAVTAGDNTITALATAVDRVMGIAAGTSGIVFSGTGLGGVAVTLPVGRFKSIPAITATADTSSLIFASVSSVTGVGFTLSGRAYTGTLTATVQCHWIALEKG